ncbi:MAG: CpsD/CapB family tyrosine-protein kinase, partial [Deltaproteobacteria bacterium]|nr:CpsD/CapB family tyrosine-protein kinase [Deltaproteobacteria bacterium]
MDESMERAGNFLPRVERRVNLPVRQEEGLVAITSPGSVAAEQYRVLYHRLERARLEHGLRVVALTSAVSGEGKSLTAANLALVAAAADPQKKVLLVDADLRRPRLGWLLNVEERPGLGEFLEGEASLPEVVRRVQGSSVMLIPAGAPRDDPGALVGGATMRHFLEQARERFDEIYLDVPPVLPVADGAMLAAMAAGVLAGV